MKIIANKTIEDAHGDCMDVAVYDGIQERFVELEMYACKKMYLGVNEINELIKVLQGSRDILNK